MSKFYEGLTSEELKTQVETFKANFRASFGQEVALWEVADALQTVLYRKRIEFIEQSFGDYPPTTIEALRGMFHSEEQAKTRPHVEALAKTHDDLKAMPYPGPRGIPLVEIEKVEQTTTTDAMVTLPPGLEIEAPKPKRSHKKKEPQA